MDQGRDIFREQGEIGAGDAITGLLPGLVAHLFQRGRARLAKASRSPSSAGSVQQFGQEHVQIARRAQPAGQNLGAAAQIAQPFLAEFLAKGLQRHFQPPERDPQLMQAFDRTAGAQGGGIGRHLGQAIRQGGAKRIFRTHVAVDAGGTRLDRLGRAQTSWRASE